jgi:hypothetical protein|tara:strand:+ start:407 stop:988 length:582 start_codon:yes stop_codon:yes gene_type:complete
MSDTGWSSLGFGDKFGLITGIGSTLTGMIANRAAANTERYKLRSQALNFEHQRDMAKLNKRMLESQAQHIGRAYNKQIAIRTLKAGQAISSTKASFAARGIQMGVGSTANVFASAELVKEIDRLTMNTNKVRAMNNQRLRAVNMGIRGDMLGVSANNLFSTASAVSPFMNMTSTLLTGATNIVGNLPDSFFKK